MAEISDEAKDIEKLYEFGERLNEARDKAQHVKDYEGIVGAAKGSIKAKQLAAQLIPRFFKCFPDLHVSAVDAHFDLCEAEELGVCYSLAHVCKNMSFFILRACCLAETKLN
uniref:Apoptosis inhibitor 5 n=1 Tax=Kalanchoe fedtschenkoi TaxID=63787 RepID=A0A7N0TRF1_KALFE